MQVIAVIIYLLIFENLNIMTLIEPLVLCFLLNIYVS